MKLDGEYCITESGRIFDVSFSGKPLLELVNGKFVESGIPVYGWELYEAKPLSKEDVLSYIEKSGTPAPSHK